MITPVKLDVNKIFIGMLFGVIILVFVALVFVLTYIRNFSQSAGIPTSELFTLVKNGVQNKDMFANRRINFLFLGLDKRDDDFEKTTLTDTMLVGSLNTASGQLTTIALPRDIWLPDLATKINALYFYGEKNPATSGIQFTEDEIEKITGVKPKFTVVLNYLELPALIDAVGGVEIDVERTFEDNKYPNPEYVTTQQGTPYMTISFEKGKQVMDGSRALSFVRSRESTDPIEGSDLGRSKRQMLVIAALMKKVKSREVLESPETLGALYRFWKEKVETTLTDEDAVAIALALGKKSVTINSVAIPVASTATQDAVLVNPPLSKYGLWVWETKDKNWGELKKFIVENL